MCRKQETGEAGSVFKVVEKITLRGAKGRTRVKAIVGCSHCVKKEGG